MFGAHAAERPIDVDTAVAAHPAVFMDGAVRVLNEAEALSLLALLSDALVVG